MKFRKDINGLRAIAVIAVVLFHFKVAGFTGGFSGVDIFFVISGYLMTGIIFTKLRKNQFSLVDFYIARAKRVIPALAVLCIGLIFFGFFYLQLEDYCEVLGNIKRSIFFVSNISYYNESGYFDTPTQENWLLHTWSLSLEWQFYIVYPIVISLLYKFFSEKIIKVSLIVITSLSFIAAVYYSNHNPGAAFYLLPTRIWELAAGGLVFLFPYTFKDRARLGLELFGVLLVVFAVFFCSSNNAWPSYLTLMPILGAVIILYSCRESFITGNIVFQFIGKISYSIYLWHWPIAVFIYFCGLSESLLVILAGVLLSMLLATLSYYLVEQYFSKTNKTRNLLLVQYVALVVLMGGIISPGLASLVKKYPDIRQAAVLQVRVKGATPSYKSSCLSLPHHINDCKLGEGEPSVILLGDSHAQSISPAVQQANPQKTLLWARGGCPVLREFQFKGAVETAICHEVIDGRLQQLETSYLGIPLIIINRNSLYIDPSDISGHFISFKNMERKVTKEYLSKFRAVYLDTMCQLTAKRPVYVVKPLPEMRTNVPKSLLMQSHFVSKLQDILLPFEQYQERHQFVITVMEEAQRKCGVKLLDPTLYLCPDGKSCMGSIDGNTLYSDTNHLNYGGSALLIPLFKKIFEITP